MTRRLKNFLLFSLLLLLAALFLTPVFIVFINSFKGRFYINDAPFALPSVSAGTWAGLENYINGIEKTGFPATFGWSLFITVFSVGAIVLFTSMTGWYLARVGGRFCRIFYYALVFSMTTPFQMVMFTMSKVANILRLDNPFGIILIYLGFGAGLSCFMFAGFVKGIPIQLEEAAMIDGCGPIRTFFLVILPALRPIAVTVAILNAMWIWNDYLLPYLLLGTEYKTIPIAVQYLRGGYGAVDMGAMMAVLILSILPIAVFYLVSQKHIIRGVTAGAVKG